MVLFLFNIGYPFVCTRMGCQEMAFHVIYIGFDEKTKQVVNTKIEGPIPVCPKLFKNSKDCIYHSPPEMNKVGPLV